MKPCMLICAALIAVTAAVYVQTFDFDFTNFDDRVYVIDNEHVSSGLTLENVLWAFTARRANNWHPLTWISHMVDVELSGLDPGAHHATNVVLHVFNTLLVFVVLNRMTRRKLPSAYVAALFAVHPLHVESVAWIAERKDVLSTFLWLLTVWAYARYVERPRPARYALVVAAFLLGLLSKPMLVSLPLVLLMLDYWPLRRSYRSLSGLELFRALVIEKAPLFALSLASCVVTFWVQQTTGAVATLDAYPLGIRLANAVWAYVEYLVKAVWPVGLACYYPHPGSSLPVWQTLTSGLFLAVVTGLVIRGAVRAPYLLVGWLWYLVTLIPVIGLVQVGKQAMADRYTYVPMIGIFILAAWGVPDLARRLSSGRREVSSWLRRAGAVAAVAIIAVLTLAAHRQAAFWRNDVSIWRRALAVTEHNALAHFNLGTTLAVQGDTEGAVRHFREAVRIDPAKFDAHCNLGTMLAQKGELDEAIEHFRAAVRLKPKDPVSRSNLGVALVKRGRYAEAIPHLRAALKAHPEDAVSREALDTAVEQTQRAR